MCVRIADIHCVQLSHTIQHRTVLIISLLSPGQSQLLKYRQLKEGVGFERHIEIGQQQQVRRLRFPISLSLLYVR